MMNKKITEPAKELEIVMEADVVVCGGGPAGIGAALAAARNGASTLLIESAGCLGGIWTAGLMAWIIDHKDKSILVSELAQEMEACGVLNNHGDSCGSLVADPELVKLLLEDKCQEAGVKFLLHTRVCAAITDNGGITHAVIESKSGRQAISGKVFIDCTGDGDLGALAGCGYDLGKPDAGETQPMSLIATLSGIEADQISSFIAHGGAEKPYDNLCEELRRGGADPSYTRSTLFRIYDNLFMYMGNHQYKYSGLEVNDITEATVNGRFEINQHVKALRSLGGPWKNLCIAATAENIGVREGRRLHGLYTVTLDDLLDGREHADGICKVTFCVDVHSLNPDKSKGLSGDSGRYRVKPYDIPLRALISRDLDNLMMAGRCISGDFYAHASYRVTGNSVPCGEAAGKCAAEAALNNVTPESIAGGFVAEAG
jgi:FAD dependent oxidoreductase